MSKRRGNIGRIFSFIIYTWFERDIDDEMISMYMSKRRGNIDVGLYSTEITTSLMWQMSISFTKTEVLFRYSITPPQARGNSTLS